MKRQLIEVPEHVEAILRAASVEPPPARIVDNYAIIDRCFASDRLEDILAALEADGSDWAQKELATLRAKSPTACKVSLRLLVESPLQFHFLDEMRLEYGIVVRMFRHPDFIEGVRALLIDKDNAPRWNPATPEDVTDEMIDRIFEPLPPRARPGPPLGSRRMTDNRVWKLPESAPRSRRAGRRLDPVVENGLARCSAGAAPRRQPRLRSDRAGARHVRFHRPALVEPDGRPPGEPGRRRRNGWSCGAPPPAAPPGHEVEPVIAPERGDRRFGDAAWSEDPVFDYLKQAYLLAARQATDLVDKAEGIDEATRTRAEFFTQAYLNALSPANFAFTNPEAIRRAIDTGSISLLSGLANLLADAATDAKLPVRRASAEFELGKDIAATPGSVVFQNELMQLIQYAPATDEVYKRPLLYVPPLVNKYYLLDLQPKSSLIRWLVEQGHTLFVISWVNPGPELADKGLDDYLDARPRSPRSTRSRRRPARSEVDLFGFCMGGTLAAMAAAARRSPGRDRLADHDRLDVRFREHGPVGDLHASRPSSRRWRSISRPRA